MVNEQQEGFQRRSIYGCWLQNQDSNLDLLIPSLMFLLLCRRDYKALGLEEDTQKHNEWSDDKTELEKISLRMEQLGAEWFANISDITHTYTRIH